MKGTILIFLQDCRWKNNLFKFIVFIYLFSSTRDGTQALVHARQASTAELHLQPLDGCVCSQFKS